MCVETKIGSEVGAYVNYKYEAFNEHSADKFNIACGFEI